MPKVKTLFMEIVFIDHYDSFSYNVKDWLQSALPTNWQVRHLYCDQESDLKALHNDPKPLVLSPGPGHPSEAVFSLNLARHCLGKVPILGICLGHQILGTLAGGNIDRSKAPFHGTARKITTISPLFHLPQGSILTMAVYHSLVIEEGTLPLPWKIVARDSLGEIAAIELRDTSNGRLAKPKFWPAVGLQFHPESFLSDHGTALAEGWWQTDVLSWSTSRNTQNSSET